MADHAPASARASALALAFALGALGALPLVEGGGFPRGGGPDPLALLAWLAIAAAGAGFLACAWGERSWLRLAAVPLLWSLLLGVLEGATERELPTTRWAALALLGLFLTGAALARRSRLSPAAGAAALILAAGLLAALPARGALGSRPWPVPWAQVLLDLSPATLACECAGVDWMRHPAVYDPLQSDRFERAPFRGALAGPAALVVGCAAAAAAARRRP